MAGTPIPTAREPINEGNLPQVRELAQWGRGRVTGLDWSPDGSTLAVATTLGVYLYDAKTVSLLAGLDTRASAAGAPVYSPDGSLLAVPVVVTGETGQSFYTIQVWDAPSARWLTTLQVTGQITTLSFSADGKALAALTALERGQQKGATFSLWNISGSLGPASTTADHTLELIGGEVAQTAALSRDLSLAATHGANGPVRLWRLDDGANFATTAEPGTDAGTLAFSPDQHTLAVAYPDRVIDFFNSNLIRVWNVPGAWSQQPSRLLYTLVDYTSQAGEMLLEGRDQAILTLAWSPDGGYLAAGYADRTLHVWRAEPSPVYRFMEAESLPLGLAWSPGGQSIAAGGLEIFDLATARQVGHTNDFIPGLYDLSLAPDGATLAIAGFRMIDFRAISTGSRLFIGTGMSGQVNSVDYSPDGKYLVAGNADGVTRLYLAADGSYYANLGTAGAEVFTAVFSPNGKWVVTGRADMLIQVYRFLDGVLMLGLREPYVSYQLLYAPNVDQFASMTTSGVRLRSFGGELQKINSTLQGDVGGVGLSDMAYSPGEEFLAVVGNGVVRVINPATLEPGYTISDPNGALPFSVAYSPDNAFLAVGWSDGSIRFYWAADGTPLHTLMAHPQPVTRLIFSKDGTLLISLGAEGTIRLWGVTQ